MVRFPLFSQENVESRATQSVRVPVRNLRRADPSVDVDSLQENLGWEFLRTDVDGQDVGLEGARKQRGFQLVRPDNGWFPGIDRLREDLTSHQWIFGKTPRFKVHRSFQLPAGLAAQDGPTPPEIRLELDVHLGVVVGVRVKLPVTLEDADPLDLGHNLSNAVHGLKFGRDLPNSVGASLVEAGVSGKKADYLADCVRQMVGKFT